MQHFDFVEKKHYKSANSFFPIYTDDDSGFGNSVYFAILNFQDSVLYDSVIVCFIIIQK